jgi:hypothetical protein
VVVAAVLSLRVAPVIMVAAVGACVVLAVQQHRWGHVAGNSEVADIVIACLLAVG